MIQAAKKPLRVLIVDDDHLVRQALRAVLADQGFLPFCVSNGTAALHACATQHFDLALLDFALGPTENGINTLKVIHIQHPAIRVIIITGCPHPVLIGMAQNLNASQCLVKPIEPEALFCAIRQEFQNTPFAEIA